MPDDRQLNNEGTNQNGGLEQQPVVNPAVDQPVVQPIIEEPVAQPVLEQPAAQPVNESTFQPAIEQSVGPSAVNNKKPVSKKKLGIIIGAAVIVVALIIVGVVIGGNMLSGDKEEQSAEEKNLIGDVKLVKEFASSKIKALPSSDNLIRYPDDYDDNSKEIVDPDGNVIFKVDKGIIYGLGDGYFAVLQNGEDFTVYEHRGGKVLEITKGRSYGGSITLYNDGILYYEVHKEPYRIVAYDLKNKKEKWKIEHAADPFLLKNGTLIARNTNKDNRSGKDDTLMINKDTGKIISVPEGKDTYAKEAAYFLVDDTSVEVYEYGGKKLTTYNIEPGSKFLFALNTGGFGIQFADDSSKVFNKDGKEILSNASELWDYENDSASDETPSSPKFSTVRSRHDDVIYTIFDDDSYTDTINLFLKDKYAVGIANNNAEKLEDREFKVINLETKKEKTIPGIVGIEFETPKNNDYIVIPDGYGYIINSDTDYIFDADLNKIYSSKDSLDVANNEFFVESIGRSDTETHKWVYDTYLINKNTLDKKQINIKGSLQFCTSKNMVTYDRETGTTYLYKFI